MNISIAKTKASALTVTLKPFIAIAAIAAFAINLAIKKDYESMGWFLMCVLWALE